MDEYLQRLFGSGPSYLGQLMGEDAERLRREAQNQGLLGTGIGLLMASGPSAQRQNIGQIIGQGLMTGQQAYRGAIQQALQDKMIGLQLSEIAKKQKAEQAIPGLIQGAMVAPQRQFTDLERMEMPTPSVTTGPAQLDINKLISTATAAGVPLGSVLPLAKSIGEITQRPTKEVGGALFELQDGKWVKVAGNPKTSTATIFQDGRKQTVAVDEAGNIVGYLGGTEAPPKQEYGTVTTDKGVFVYDKSNPASSFKIADAKGESFTGEAGNIAMSLFGTASVDKLTPENRQVVLSKMMEVKSSGATRVGVNVATQGKFGEGLSKAFEETLDNARNARTTLGLVGQIESLLDAGTRTGFGAEYRAQLNRLGQVIDPNFKVPETAGVEALQAATAQLVLPQVKSLGANPTDKDLQFISAASPQLSKSSEGNRLILDALKIKAQRQLAEAQFSSQWVNTNSSFIEKNPVQARAQLENDLDKFRETAPVYKTTGEDLKKRFQSLRSGTGLPPGVRVTRER